MKEKRMKYQTKQIVMFTVMLVSIFTLIASVSYAVFSVQVTGTKKYSLTVGTLDFVLDNETNSIRLMNAYPMADTEGSTLNPYTFTITNTGTLKLYYKISLLEDEEQKSTCEGCTFLNPNKLRYALTTDGNAGTPNTLFSDTILETGELEPNASKNYELRLWLNQDATIEEENKYYYGRIKVDASQEKYKYVDASGANIPELTSGMIPVTYDESAKTWKKADTSSKWYDYNKQWWANAVTVTETSRATYMNAEPGTPISMDDINTMWVWIPRYEYQYTDLGTSYAGGTKTQPGEIKVNFISKDTTTPSDTNTYKISEGFTFGEENLPGFWMAKFETTGYIDTICMNEDCEKLDLTVLPNSNSLRSVTVSNFFYASRSMQNGGNAKRYGFDTIGTGTMDVHMLKNSEWGIVAMLSQSKYGKYGNTNYTGANKEVAINNCNNYITGIGGDTVSASSSSTTCTTNTYETGKGQAASTAGTIYGVYDMSGGRDEYVMGNYNDTDAATGFINFPDTKYYDKYIETTASTGYKQGDATYETSGWYSDQFNFVDSYYTWFFRGGRYSDSTSAGVLSSFNGGGDRQTEQGFRLTIKP